MTIEQLIKQGKRDGYYYEKHGRMHPESSLIVGDMAQEFYYRGFRAGGSTYRKEQKKHEKRSV